MPQKVDSCKALLSDLRTVDWGVRTGRVEATVMGGGIRACTVVTRCDAAGCALGARTTATAVIVDATVNHAITRAACEGTARTKTPEGLLPN